MSEDARRRVVVEGVFPEVDCGQFPVKRVVGEKVDVEADVFVDGHDALQAVVRYRRAGEPAWIELPMEPLGNDRYRGSFSVEQCGVYEYTVEAWIDGVQGWRRDLDKKAEAGQDIAVDLLVGAALARAAAARAEGTVADQLRAWADRLGDRELPVAARLAAARDEDLTWLARRHPDRSAATRSRRVLRVVVEPRLALAGAWYELFPRSTSPDPGRTGTFADLEAQLERVANMGFDVVYLPPIHPIGRAQRKGPNNDPQAAPRDPGSPWAIGAAEGGHDAVHPELGTLEQFRRLVARAAEKGLHVALDLAFQCAPDHPYVAQHPQWFRRRPDGSIQHAENPPKKYEDIVPFDFESEDWQALWRELERVVRFWIAQGITVFRVDNPHTKALPFWEWLIAEIKRDHPETIFLAEAFTRPRMMYRLAKLGFSQSYTYFAWRNTRHELESYFRELYRPPVVEFFRPNLWPNTPDILTEYLQTGGRAAFAARLVLAATLGASYGIYGPAYELAEATPREPGSEEYLDSEKYQVRHWRLDRFDSLEPLIARVNRVRRENPALLRNRGLLFHAVDNDQLICYSKTDEAGTSVVIVVVNLDPHHTHSGWIDLPLEPFGIDPRRAFQVHDLLSDARYLWHGNRHFVQLDPRSMPAHIFRLRRFVRTEHDFEYYL
ncbi:MAG: alpha-1,4-glucan--maltose-1-phosphate maltosyltransferase [Acidobacteria bacterium]|nr:alpha-1,4-glucan--maltose-1-phosphate maltosyltransferase [Acidobacteriota bacterium]